MVTQLKSIREMWFEEAGNMILWRVDRWFQQIYTSVSTCLK